MTASDPEPTAARRRWSPAIARLLARMLRSASLFTSILLGVVSLLIAFSAFQSSYYSDLANDNLALANRMSTDAINQSQSDLAEHLTDTQVWVQIATSGESLDSSPLTGLLSDRWLDAARRFEAQGHGTDVLPTDQRYFDELHVESIAHRDRIKAVFARAGEYGATSSRLTGASVIYSAALLLLTVASTAGRSGIKLGLNVVAVVIMVVAILIGFGPSIESLG
ncbi:MAG TPA: hypothetical protein VNS80_02615 [Pseudolysinimonas sp.]|nr:hypothetical protein [Pseudolysinimonas sp.]